MYTFNIKDSGPDVTTVVIRCLLVLAALASLLYNNEHFLYLNSIAAVILFMLAITLNLLVSKYNVSAILLLGIASFILFIATHSIAFAVILMGAGLAMKKLYKKPVVNVNSKGIIIKNTLGAPVHDWSEFNNIILKDNLLTLDFKDNKLLQLSIIESGIVIDEGSFNNFCSGFIGV